MLHPAISTRTRRPLRAKISPHRAKISPHRTKISPHRAKTGPHRTRTTTARVQTTSGFLSPTSYVRACVRVCVRASCVRACMCACVRACVLRACVIACLHAFMRLCVCIWTCGHADMPVVASGRTGCASCERRRICWDGRNDNSRQRQLQVNEN